jgi:hypothetical protein
MQRWLAIACLSCLLHGCDSGTHSNAGNRQMQLIALSPYTYEFTGPKGSNRIDYFFVASAYSPDAQFRDRLYALAQAQAAPVASRYALYSIYIYAKTATLNAGFTGKADDLRGVFDNDLLGYGRWSQGASDVFYIVEAGNVVFDMIKNAKVSPSWEFD